VLAKVDEVKCNNITGNHTATNLLHAKLENQIGKRVQQRRSLVSSDRLHFNFSYNKSLSETSIQSIESEINKVILDNMPIITLYTDQKTK